MRLFPFFLLAITLTINSCSDKHERKIKSHFNKFILKGKLKDYEIEKIKRNIITISQEQTKLTNDEISRKIYEIGLYSKTVIMAKEQLDEIKKGTKRNYNGVTYYSTKNLFPHGGFYNATANEGFIDFQNEGKEKMIENKINYIQKQFNQIPKLENDIKILQIKLDSIKSRPNKSPKWINSVVTIRGMEPTGLKRINYFVVQYPDGEIKSLNY